MAWSFGDSFDLYAASADALNGYWDSGNGNAAFNNAGRFSGSRCFTASNAGTLALVKASNVNDAVHHFVLSFNQNLAISGTNVVNYITLYDGATAQCTIAFQQGGSIVLQTGAVGGAALATYASAFTVNNTWYAFEIEVVINATTGSFSVRKNGNNVNDFTLGSLNTRGGTANNYANKIGIGASTGFQGQYFDDFFWRSDASSVAWMGDIRCYARMPASDQSVTFSRSPASVTSTPSANSSAFSISSTTAYYSPLVPVYDGTISAAILNFNAAFTGNVKLTLFNDASGSPGTVLASATTLTNPVLGSNTFVFSSPPAVVHGVQYWLGIIGDSTQGSTVWMATGSTGKSGSSTYASFPVASPTVSSGQPFVASWTTVFSKNASLVSEAQQDGATTYVYDSNPGDADFYGVGSIASTPAQVIATTIRAYMQKSDAGTRTAAVQLKSGATTVASPTLTLSSSGWLWAWRTDLVDPATGAAWTAAGVNNAQVGPKTVA